MDRVVESYRAQVAAYEAYQAARYEGWLAFRRARDAARAAAAEAEAAQLEAFAAQQPAVEQSTLF